MNYTVHLDTNELRALSDKILRYADDFERKVTIFLNKLANVGIEVASVNGGAFSSYIEYSKKQEDGTTVYLVASSGHLTAEWYAGSKSRSTRHEDISPLLMAEFGSGFYAIKSKGEASGLGGQGTLNKYHHANDPEGWYWYAEREPIGDGEPVNIAKSGKVKYHSKGPHHTQPLHKAVLACIEQVNGIAHEVFG